MSDGKDYLGLPLREFLADTGAKSPTPGGGSVAAVTGALAASLARMAVAYTAGKPAYAEHETRLRGLLDELAEAVERFGGFMADDMAAYEAYAASRKGSAEQQQQAVQEAARVPLAIVALAERVAAWLDECKEFINPYLYSDLEAAAVLADAAGRAAATSVRVNLSALTDRDEATRLEAELADLLERLDTRRRSVADHRPG